MKLRNDLYKYFIKSATEICYQASLESFFEHANVLDVGIGNGIMLEKFHPLIKSKGLKITGIDINRVYLNHCCDLISKDGLKDHIEIYCRPVESFAPNPGLEFDYIFFSMSFMLLDDSEYVLDRVKEWLAPNGKIVFFQTMYKNSFPLMDFIKPKLKYFTTVEFGRVTYEDEFFALLSRKGLRVIEDRLLSKEWFRGEYRLISAAF